ncbi:tRNA-splicing endonuclease subunit Sen2-like isoform X1 [Acropora millepora]|uniref:tRNA-splicing endonuclease subunit Sen2-like isoform X1 n=1 Tax=Acropora millepora TaxID=45264 RepID=UPI001CF353AE|nr:tRNA-splicing endonuclease subunit Sen2-like isoform X1 [Acropora millepora]XP_044181936.1 tRNA-splicing endonuclease subunit Sen2-like isoform X1 [Acropora millepora]XP_044181937.1 tRNA-splicing endonuclease subunit Sen2-like isoform X1 [Acropora millepora]
MADTAIRNPRRKKGARLNSKDSPFPIPIQSITRKDSCCERWYYYTGYLRDDCVVIEDLGDLTFLYKMGFFGKGFLSRSKPEYEVISDISQKAFSKSEKLRRLPPREREIRQSKFRLIRKERYKNHKQWYEQVTGHCLAKDAHVLSKDEEGDNSIDHTNCDEQMNVATESVYDSAVEEPSPFQKRRRVDKNVCDDEACKSQPKISEEVSTTSTDIQMHFDDDDDDDDDEDSETDTDDCKAEMNSTIADDNETEANISNRELEEVMQDVVKKSNQFKPRRDIMEQNEHDQITQKKTFNDVKKDDPYKVYEQLQLTLEEAFFLSYGLGCLSVLNRDKRPMSLREMWYSFCAAKKDFISSYVTYHYFRSKGWVPKVGLKYGTDWVLYKEGMPFYHSSYSVIVQMIESDHLELDKNNGNMLSHQLTWPQLCGVSRVSGHAAKEVMLCFVIPPADMTIDELSSPKCITRFKIQEIVLRRWIPERAREPDKNT